MPRPTPPIVPGPQSPVAQAMGQADDVIHLAHWFLTNAYMIVIARGRTWVWDEDKATALADRVPTLAPATRAAIFAACRAIVAQQGAIAPTDRLAVSSPGDAMSRVLTPHLVAARDTLLSGASQLPAEAFTAWLIARDGAGDYPRQGRRMEALRETVLAAIAAGWTGAAFVQAWPHLPHLRGHLLRALGSELRVGTFAAATDPLVRYCEELLVVTAPTATPRVPKDRRDQIRRVLGEALARRERHDPSPESQVTRILDTYFREGPTVGTLLTSADLATLPWVTPPAVPTIDDITRFLPRFRIPPYSPRMTTQGVRPALAAIRALVRTPATFGQVPALWASATTTAQQQTLLFHGDLLEAEGPWWMDAAWREDAFTVLGALPVDFAWPEDAGKLAGLFALTLGHVDPDTWLRALLGWAGTQREVSLHRLLDGALHHPTWRPTAEGLLPLLGHTSARVRQLAQLAVTRTIPGRAAATPPTPSPSPLHPAASA